MQRRCVQVGARDWSLFILAPLQVFAAGCLAVPVTAALTLPAAPRFDVLWSPTRSSKRAAVARLESLDP